MLLLYTNSVYEGIIIGGAGGAIAGITLFLIQELKTLFLLSRDKKRVFKWIEKNTEDKIGFQFRSTKAISSYTNLPKDRVRYICSVHNKIHMSTGKEEDMWSVHVREEDSIYEERGVQTID